MGKICCFHCQKKCKGDVLKVGDKYFHKECFTCKICHKKMENTGFFCKDDSFYCSDDYKKYCASLCFSCNEKIVGEVVTALNHTFHKECFKCSLCQKCFSAGDKVSMRGSNFLCTQCCERSVNVKEIVNTKTSDDRPALNNQPLANGYNHVNLSKSQYQAEFQSSTMPIRRKNNQPANDRPLSNSMVHSINSPSNGRGSEISMGDNNLDLVSRSSLIVTPKHFHLPPGNSRSWLYNSPIVGTKTHPLALSVNNINRSLSNSSQKIYTDDTVVQDRLKKISSYPYGDIGDGIMKPQTNQEPRPVLNTPSTIMSDQNRRKIQNPTVEALSVGTTPRLRKARSSSHKADGNGTSGHGPSINRVRHSEALKMSSADSTSIPRMNDCEIDENDITRDPISASRSPSAVCEPLVPPRYDDHTETSPSRNDDYFRSPSRHLGYSMEFLHSTNRSLTSENSHHGNRGSLRNSTVELQYRASHNQTGPKKTPRVNSNIVDYKATVSNKRHHSDRLVRDSQSSNKTVKTIPYDQLRVSNLKMIRNIDKSNLESYLADEEFIRLFHITKSGFYQLPEWKRNDLKKRVDLF